MPHKTCSLDCIYCESGATTRFTSTCDEYVSKNRVKAELREFLSGNPHLDYITFSGSGEPMLHTGIGDIIRFIKTEYPEYKVAVLTNGTLLYRPKVKTQILDADVLKVSLDAVSQKVFDEINRPCDGLKLAPIIDGLRALRKDFSHQFWVEVFLVPGLNDTPEELEKIRKVLRTLDPHRVQLNTLDRPGTEGWVTAVCRGDLERIAAYLLDAEIIKHFDDGDAPKTKHLDDLAEKNAKHLDALAKINAKHLDDLAEKNAKHLDKGTRAQGERKKRPDPISSDRIGDRILSTIKRRPCTADDMARQLDLTAAELYSHLDSFLEEGTIVKKEMLRGIFYGLN